MERLFPNNEFIQYCAGKEPAKRKLSDHASMYSAIEELDKRYTPPCKPRILAGISE
jgi:hypothetical protein